MSAYIDLPSATREHETLGAMLATLGALPVADAFTILVNSRFGHLPFPGEGATLQRWAALADVGGHDLSLVKLYEAHHDARAILHELDVEAGTGTWGVWAAEGTVLVCTERCESANRPDASLSGVKNWCSGAACVQRGLLTARGTSGEKLLVAVAMDDPGIAVESGDWASAGMALAKTASIRFTNARAIVVARDDVYVARPGFWHGAIGVAACWYGAAAALAETLLARLRQRHDAHGLALLGAVDQSLFSARAALTHAAHWIDQHPGDDARGMALRTRRVVEQAVERVMLCVGHAVGAAPFALDADFSRRMADLTVFVRQSHAERDDAQLGECLLQEAPQWTLQ